MEMSKVQAISLPTLLLMLCHSVSVSLAPSPDFLGIPPPGPLTGLIVAVSSAIIRCAPPVYTLTCFAVVARRHVIWDLRCSIPPILHSYLTPHHRRKKTKVSMWIVVCPATRASSETHKLTPQNWFWDVLSQLGMICPSLLFPFDEHETDGWNRVDEQIGQAAIPRSRQCRQDRKTPSSLLLVSREAD